MSTLLTLQNLLNRRLQLPGLNASACEYLQRVEGGILVDSQLHAEAAMRAKNKRGVQTMPPYDPQHVQGIPRRVTISKPDGSKRETWAPTNNDYAMACYPLLGILNPMLQALSSLDTHGFIRGRSVVTAILQLMAEIDRFKDPVVVQTDVMNWFPTVPVREALTMLPPNTAHTTLQIHHRYRQAIGGGSPYQGLPQGHPMAAAVATLMLDKILMGTRARFAAVASIIVFADDITVAAQDQRTADHLMAHMGAALSRYGVKLNPKKTRWTLPHRGGSMQCLGYRIDWPEGGSGPRIRPTARAYRRLAERLHICMGPEEAAEVIRGWMEAFRLTNDPEARNDLNAMVHSTQRHPANLVNPTTHHAPTWEDIC